MRSKCSQIVVENFFEPGILFLLLKKSSYGYELQKDLKKQCICEVNIGNLYRCLSRLNKQRHIKRTAVKSKIGPKKYSYTITGKGKIYLSSWIDGLKKQKDVISLLINNYQKIV